MNAVVTAKSVLMLGIAGWMIIAVLNNATDPGTNRFHLGMMFELALLSEEPNGLGQNLRWRALPAAITAPVVAVQAAVTAYLWKAAWSCAAAALQSPCPPARRRPQNRGWALTCFMALWLCFMIGGFWFGYWIKQGAIQQVHMTLLILSVLSIGFVGNRQLEGDSVTVNGRVSD